MKIDRHNYEEFFILYWDNELTAVQKQAVEDFVKQNADLREEFEILSETRFTPDTDLRFKEKDFLLNDSFINITNYEEQLLNYIDDEVSDDERKKVEKFVELNPTVQSELALLQKTKLQPEEDIIFPGKPALYRREEKVRIISMTWFRVAVAAAIVVIAGFTVLQFVNTGKNGDVPTINGSSIAKNRDAKKNEVKDQPKNSEKSTANPATPNTSNSLTKGENKKTDQQKEMPAIKPQLPIEQNAIALTKEPENKNNLPKPRNRFISDDQSVNTDAVVAQIDLPVLKRDDDKIQKKQSDAINASLSNSDVTKKPELALYIPEQQAKEKDGGGIKEFLRKTTRVFERRTKIQTTTDDNKLLVGAFAVSLK